MEVDVLTWMGRTDLRFLFKDGSYSIRCPVTFVGREVVHQLGTYPKIKRLYSWLGWVFLCIYLLSGNTLTFKNCLSMSVIKIQNYIRICFVSPSGHSNHISSPPRRASSFYREHTSRFFLGGSHSVYMEEGVGWAADRECFLLLATLTSTSQFPDALCDKLSHEPCSCLVGLTATSLFRFHQFQQACLSLKNFSK